MNLVKRLAAMALLVCLAAGMLTGCGDSKPDAIAPGSGSAGKAGQEVKTSPVGQTAKTAPSAPVATAAQNVAIPAPQAVDDPSVFVMARLHDPNQLVERLGSWASMVQPTINAEVLRTQLAQSGFDLKQIKPGENISMFALAPPPGEQAPAGALILPVDSKTTLAQVLSGMMGNTRMLPVGSSTMLVPTEGGGTTATMKKGPELVKLSQSPTTSDLQVYVNASALMTQYGPLLNAQAQMLTSMMGGMGTTETAQFMPLVQAGVQGVLAKLNQVQYLNLGLDLGADRLDLTAILRGKPGTELASVFQAGPAGPPDLAAYVDADAFERIEMSIGNMQQMVDLGMNILQAMATPAQQAEVAKMKEDLKEMSKLGQIHGAVSVGVTLDGKLKEEVLVITDNNDVYLDLLRKTYVNWVNAGLLHDMIKKMGVDISMTQDPAPRKVEGADVYHYTMTVKGNENMPAAQKAQLEKMLGSLSYEVGKVGKYVVITLGEPIDALAKRVASNQPGKPLQATKVYPAGGCFYIDYSIAQGINMMKASMPPEQAGMLPNFAPGAPPVVGAGYLSDGMACLRLGLPKGLLTSLKPPQESMPGAIPPPAGAK